VSGTSRRSASGRAVVVGAGIAGLTSAFRLQQAGCDVVVLEATDDIGGKMSSIRLNWFTMNRAANILPSSYATIQGLARDVGLAHALGEIPAVLGVLRDGRVREVRASGARMALDGLRTDLLSWRSKLLMRRLVWDAVRMRGSLSYANLGAAAPFDTETVAEYCRRRLNPELEEYLVEPLIRGLFTSNADRVSVVDLFFTLVNLVGSGFMGYPGGIDFLCRALADRVEVRTGSRVTLVEDHGAGVRVSYEDGTGAHELDAEGCVLAVSGTLVTSLYPQLDPVQAKILDEHLEYCVTYTGHFGLSTRPVGSSLVIPVPKSEDEGLCVVTFDHNSSPGSAPPGKGLVSGYWLHEWSLARRHLDDEQLTAQMLVAMEKVVPGITRSVEATHIARWDPAVLRSYPGMYRWIGELAARMDGGSRVQLAGDYLSASSTNGCALSGEMAADRLASGALTTPSA
jgi:oxygen-dependent protoporphyrinogen oxidase